MLNDLLPNNSVSINNQLNLNFTCLVCCIYTNLQKSPLNPVTLSHFFFFFVNDKCINKTATGTQEKVLAVLKNISHKISETV